MKASPAAPQASGTAPPAAGPEAAPAAENVREPQGQRPGEGSEDASTRRNLGLIGLFGLLGVIGLLGGLGWVVMIFLIVAMLFMHELGHYATARLTGMKVTEFFIGFGPRVWSLRRGETEYGIKALWAGAYVRIVGMNNLDQIDPEDESRSFRSQSFPRRLLVLVAGSGMHFLMAIGLLFAALSIDAAVLGGGDPAAEVDRWTLDTVSYESAANAAGLQPGDEVLAVNGVRSGTFAEFSRHVQTLGGEQARILVRRGGEEFTVSARIGERLTAQGAEGIEGLIAGDRILEVEGMTETPPSYAAFSQHLRGRLGEPLDITIVDVRTGRKVVVENAVVNDLAPPDSAVQGFFGVSADYPREGLGLLAAARESVTLSWRILGEVVFAVPKIVTDGFLGAVIGLAGDDPAPQQAGTARDFEVGRLDTSHPDENRILSIYGVARIGTEVASDGVADLLILMVFVNIFIGVFNLLPLPPLDGGHVAVAVYERLRSIGRGARGAYSIDAAKLLPLTYAVVAILVLIGGIALARDILDPISLG